MDLSASIKHVETAIEREAVRLVSGAETDVIEATQRIIHLTGIGHHLMSLHVRAKSAEPKPEVPASITGTVSGNVTITNDGPAMDGKDAAPEETAAPHPYPTPTVSMPETTTS